MSTLKTNNIQHVDRSDPSIIINTDGSVNIAGTMTYEDVTNVDAVGIITGRNNIDAQKQVLVGTGVSIKAGGLNVTAGISTLQAVTGTTAAFSGEVDIADKIVHNGDTNTAIRFPAADTFTVETGGSERARVDSVGNVLLGLTSTLSSNNARLQIAHTNGNADIIVHRAGNNANPPGLNFQKTRNASIGNYGTIVQDDDELGSIRWGGADGSNIGFAARIVGAVDGTPGANDMPGRLQFHTSADGSEGMTERMRITSDGHIEQTIGASNVGFDQVAAGDHYISNVINANRTTANDHIFIQRGLWNDKEVAAIKFRAGADTTNKDDGYITFETSSANNVTERLRVTSAGELLLGATASATVGGGAASLHQIETTSQNAISCVAHRGTGNASGSIFILGKSRGTSAGSVTAVASGDELGALRFAGADGTDLQSRGAEISCEVDTTPGSNDMPGRLLFKTTADSASSSTERMRIDRYGVIRIGNTDSQATSGTKKRIAIGKRGSLMGYTSGHLNGHIQLIDNYYSDGSSNYIIEDGKASFLSLREGSFRFGNSSSSGTAGNVAPGINERVRIDTDGLSFNGDTAAANCLDDYEEGTAVPDFANADNSIVTVNRYTYTKVGRLVHFEAKFTVGSNNDGSGFGFTLPVAQGGSRETVIPAISTRSGTTTTPFAFVVNANQSYAYAKQLDGFGTGNVEYVDFAGDIILVSGTYEST